MWMCRARGLGMVFKAVFPDTDEDGCYFLCVGCEHWNTLVNVGGAHEVALMQTGRMSHRAGLAGLIRT
jgi:hypothetical protein